MANTGKKRSLTVEINKTVNGVTVSGYPKTYQGRNEFNFNGQVYPLLSKQEMARMPLQQYQARLAAFQGWIQSQEPGINFETDVTPGAEAYKDDTSMCPIGE